MYCEETSQWSHLQAKPCLKIITELTKTELQALAYILISGILLSDV
jgi:hypothetical protein